MDKMDWNGEGFRYRIQYKIDEPGHDWITFDVEDQKAVKLQMNVCFQ